MRTQAKLCHCDQGRCVVLVEGFEGDRSLGSALGEAATVMDAEDLAIARLQQRSTETPVPTKKDAGQDAAFGESDSRTDQQKAIRRNAILRKPSAAIGDPQQNASTKTESGTQPVEEKESQRPLDQTQQRRAPSHNPMTDVTPSEAPTDPEDWSEELTAIDLELQRIGWDRDQERIYLERAFGHGSRHRLTRFNDLVAYLKRLRDLQPNSDPQLTPIPLRRSDLIKQSDEILQRLQWNQDQAKQFLHQNFQATSRQQLSDEQLLTFNMCLEEQLVATSDN